MATTPKLTIRASRLGVERVIVHTDPDGPADEGLALLRRALPSLANLDRRVRPAKRSNG